jgi:hypothetical protein
MDDQRGSQLLLEVSAAMSQAAQLIAPICLGIA